MFYICVAKIVSCTYLFISGVLLLKMIKEYTALYPKRLVRNIYILLIMLVSAVPLFVAYWGIYIMEGYYKYLDIL